MHKKFEAGEFETKWQQHWAKKGIYATKNSDKRKVYVLDMFPYPSGEGLHVGHPKGYIATDIYSRFKRMSGFEVLHPMGWDAFGLPAENFAIKNKVHPRVAVEKNVKRFKEQLSLMGFDYDWDREINTTDPGFYKWTQWIFIQLYKKGLAYESFEPINWCPGCQTGLANEDLESDGTCERCGSKVEKRPMRQWVLKIRDYADRMLEDLDELNWPEHIKEAQRNWIGRSEGAEIDFKLNTGETVTVFTTRPDTLFGATYLVVAPEGDLILSLSDKINNWAEVEAYREAVIAKKEIERLDDTKEKTGVCLQGITATNPVNGESIPVYTADYVLASYGTGAIMAVPAHDERDFAFASKYGIQKRTVIQSPTEVSVDSEAYTGTGTLVNSGEFNNLSAEEAKRKICDKVGGRPTKTYKIKDWVFSRQRYWGEPFPIVQAEDGKTYTVSPKQLPVTLPEVEHYEPAGDGQSPLANITDWVNVVGYVDEEGDFVVSDTVPAGKVLLKGKRETNTMPQWAGSSWYYLRYLDPQNDKALADPQIESKWSPVDVYVGGDHAVRHLIYARFWHKFLYDIGVVSQKEPFTRLEFLGFILAEDGRKMSKRWGNVINPDDIVKLVGADTLRVYEMFMGPFENTIAWSKDGLVGARRFLERVNGLSKHLIDMDGNEISSLLHKTIKKVGEDIENFKFNTAVSAMMIFINTAERTGLSRSTYEAFLKLLAPFAPHLTEELWSESGHEDSIHLASFPEHKPELAVTDTVIIGVQINGRLRGTISASPKASEEEIMSEVKSTEVYEKYLKLASIKKIIYVPGRILNLLVE